MFEGFRKNSQSLMLIVLVGSMATLFGTQFGPGARSGGCNRDMFREQYIARVYGHRISEIDYQSGMRVLGGRDDRNNGALPDAVVDGLIERELLAHEADRLGMTVSDAELNQQIRDGYYYTSVAVNLPTSLRMRGLNPLQSKHVTSYSFDEQRDPSAAPPPFAYEDFDRWVRSVFSRTVPDYKRVLEREILAERMREAVYASVTAPDDELWRDYQREHNTVAVRYLKFSPDFYRLAVRDDDAAVTAFATAHQADIDRAYAERHDSLRGLPAQLKYRVIEIAFPVDADDAAKNAASARAESLRRQVAGGGDFTRLARLYSQDERSWRDGGEQGWIAVDQVNASAAVKTALAALQPGQTAPQVVRDEQGAWVVQLVGRREGDVPEADAKRDIAREQLRIARGGELAAAAAARAQQLLGEPGATLDTVGARVRSEALEAFYRGAQPAAVTVASGNTLEVVAHTDAGAPDVQETQPFSRDDNIPEIAQGQPVARAAFALTAEHPSPPAPIAVGDDRYLVRLKDNGRHAATREEFEHDRPQRIDAYIGPRRYEALRQYISRLRTTAERANQLRIGNSPLVRPRPAEPGTPGQAAS